jgi:hypothetical protein
MAHADEPMPWEVEGAEERVCPSCGAVVWFFNHRETDGTLDMAHATPACVWFLQWAERHKT